MKTDIFEIVREAEDNFLNGETQMGEYVSWSMHDTLERIDAYLNSKHTSGSTDSLGREKPFFNIVTAAANVWYRATDIDRKDIRILPDKSSSVAMAFIATVLLKNWMRSARFGTFLNEWGRTLSRYGSAVVKFVEKDGELIASVIPWNRLIVDPIDFDAIPRIEKFYKTPSQLRKMKEYDQKVVDNLITAISTRKTLDGNQKDNQSNFIELYEVHGELPEYMLTDKEIDNEEDIKYRQQMHVIAFVSGGNNGEYQDFCLFKGKEKKDPYMITHLIPEDGRTLSIGSVEYLFDAQWMQNHSVKNIKDTLDLASKLIFQTADKHYVGKNVLTAIETGDIMIHDENRPLTQINNSKADVASFQNFQAQWQRLASELTSTPDAIKGNTLPSGTSYSLGAYLGAQATSLFEVMTENKGLHIEDMMRQFIIPFLKTKMDSKDEIVGILEDHEITEIDAMYVPREAVKRFNTEFKQQLIKGNIPSPYQQDIAEQGIQKELSPLGNKRFFRPDEIGEKSWKESLEDFQMEAVVEVTSEEGDKQAILTTLSTLLQSIAANPAILQDPNARMLFNKILTETAIVSPIQITAPQAQPTPTASPPGGAEALSELTTEQNV